MLEGDKDVISTSPGTPAFLAPEACQYGAFSPYPLDVWAIGVTLWVMLYGKLPFFGPGILGIYHAIKNDPLSFPADNVDEDLKDLLSRILDKDPHSRMTIHEIKCHPWVTMHDRWPFITHVERITQSTDQDIAIAITEGRENKIMDQFIMLTKLKSKFGKRVSRAREKLSQRKSDNALADLEQ